jgi:hypothetical protein
MTIRAVSAFAAGLCMTRDATRSRYDLEDTRIDLISKLMNAQVNFLAISGMLEKSISGSTLP